MELKTKNGNLTLGSAYKLIYTAWIVSWGALVGLILLLLILTMIFTGEMTVNGHLVQGRSEAFRVMIPMIVVFPIIIIIHAFTFGGVMVGGLWLYRKKSPLRVTEKE